MPDMSKDKLIEYAKKHRLRRVLVVTALPIETQAVRAHIKQLASIMGRAGTIYECGQFSTAGEEWLVVVAESGAGTHPAQGIVTNAHIDFEAFEIVAFVGVAGSRKKEAPVGSVVASRVVYYAHSGKHDAEHGFTYRPRSFPITPRLVSIAVKIERDRKWSSRVLPPLHVELPGEDKYPKPVPPNALVAPIISVEAVSADPNSELEKQITFHNGDAVAVEMEGYGAAHAAYQEQTPFIIVRGISDNRGDKNPETDAINQPVAAAHAAAFAFELLTVWGQFYPLMPTPLPSSDSPTAKAAPVENAVSNISSAANEFDKKPNTFVLNFEGKPDDFPPDRVEAILEKLRNLTGNAHISLVRTEEGSFRIVFRATLKDRQKLDDPDTHAALLRDHSAKLIGVLDEKEYLAVRTLEDTLRQASRALLEWPQTLPGGAHLARPEAKQILSVIEGSDSSTTAILGPPGSGKSALLASIGNELIARGIPTLAIKADLLDPSIQSEMDLQLSLSLPTTPSLMLAETSRLRPVVLIVDQLDALAGYVDLRTGRLSALLNLIRKLGDRKNIHVLLSSRTFEFEHDTRLKAVRAESIVLSLPAWSAVLPVLESLSIQAAGWPTDAQELMRSPQSLSTYLKLARRIKAAPFRTYQSMLDQLWQEQILDKPSGSRLAKLASAIAEDMGEKETLWLPIARFDEQADDIRSLISSGILVDYEGAGSRVGFSHQTVFEHALARAFARGEGRLSSYILKRQSSLFVRPKLWAALTYLRDVDPPTYESELMSLWSTTDMRSHLRHMLVEFMGQQESPTAFEASLFEQALSSDQRRTALLAIAGSAGWLRLLAPTHVSRAMLNNDESGLAFNILNSAWPRAFETIVALVKRNWMPDMSSHRLAWTLLQNCPNWTDEVVLVAQEIIESTTIEPYTFDYLISTIGVEQPEVALKLVATRLNGQLREAIKVSESKNVPAPLDASVADLMIWRHTHSQEKPLTDAVEQRDGWEGLEALAKAKPGLFLKYIWPWFHDALAALRRIKEDDERLGFPIPWALDLKFSVEDELDVQEPPLLGALTGALEALAEENQELFLEWLSKHEREDATPAQRLFANAMAKQPETYAERAAQFLLDDKRRFHLGSIQDVSGTTKRLLKAVSPFWSHLTLDTFANEVMAYRPPPPLHAKGKGWLHFNNTLRHQILDLLSCLPEERISQQVRLFLAEERRRFPEERRGAKFSGGWIGSPISAQSLSKASDDDILNAFKKVPDSTEWSHPKQWMKGGNIQLSREFAEFSKSNPERAAQIIEKFEPSFGTRAAGYALDAMAESASPEMILSLIEILNRRGFKAGEFRRSVANAIQRLVQRDIPIDDSILNMLKGWLTEPEATEADEAEEGKDEVLEPEAPEEEDSKKDQEAKGSVLWGMGGLSVLPHGNFPILEAITRLLLGRKDSDGLLALYRQHLDTPEDPAVWRALLRYVRFIQPVNVAGLAEFLSQMIEKYPQIATTLEAIHMLAYIHWRLPDFVWQAISPWKSSDKRRLQQVYGELITLIALVQPGLSWPKALLDEITSAKDMDNARLGAAYAAVNIWPEAANKGPISKLLVTLAPVADKAMWIAIFDLFRVVDEVTPEPEWISLLTAIADNVDKIQGVSSTFVVERLQTLLPHQAPLIARLAKGLVDGWRDEMGDVRTATASSARELVDLAITLHRLGPETREAGISLFEELLRINAYTARETLDEIDNRFRVTPRSPRQRLPRRARKVRSAKRA
jgi:nucleoside phosphorylase